MTVSIGDAHVSNINLSFLISWSGFVNYNFTIPLMDQNVLKFPEYPELTFFFMEIANVTLKLMYSNFKACGTPWSRYLFHGNSKYDAKRNKNQNRLILMMHCDFYLEIPMNIHYFTLHCHFLNYKCSHVSCGPVCVMMYIPCPSKKMILELTSYNLIDPYRSVSVIGRTGEHDLWPTVMCHSRFNWNLYCLGFFRL